VQDLTFIAASKVCARNPENLLEASKEGIGLIAHEAYVPTWLVCFGPNRSRGSFKTGGTEDEARTEAKL
jgi:hypothetical protein